MAARRSTARVICALRGPEGLGLAPRRSADDSDRGAPHHDPGLHSDPSHDPSHSDRDHDGSRSHRDHDDLDRDHDEMIAIIRIAITIRVIRIVMGHDSDGSDSEASRRTHHGSDPLRGSSTRFSLHPRWRKRIGQLAGPILQPASDRPPPADPVRRASSTGDAANPAILRARSVMKKSRGARARGESRSERRPRPARAEPRRPAQRGPAWPGQPGVPRAEGGGLGGSGPRRAGAASRLPATGAFFRIYC
jgi:hypothetical protein